MWLVPLEDLQRGTGRGLVDGYLPLPVSQIRRMACDARTIPVVLGSQGEILDVGRTTRTVPRAIRRALIHRDFGCTFPNCDRKAKWCQAHHLVAWADGGPTTLDHRALVCGYHHRILHHADWQVIMIDRRPWYWPPAHLDPDRTLRRNTLHIHRTHTTDPRMFDPWNCAGSPARMTAWPNTVVVLLGIPYGRDAERLAGLPSPDDRLRGVRRLLEHQNRG